MENPTVQDIFHSFYLKYLDRYTPSAEQAKVSHCIMNCKTGAYGANVSVCEDCGHLQIHYNSCRKPLTVHSLLFITLVSTYTELLSVIAVLSAWMKTLSHTM